MNKTKQKGSVQLKITLLYLFLILHGAYTKTELKADPKTMFHVTRQNVLGLGVPETDLRLRQNLGLMFTQHKRLLTNKLSFLAHFNLDFPMREYREWLEKINTPISHTCISKELQVEGINICDYYTTTFQSLDLMQQSKVQKIHDNLEFIDNIGHNTVVKEPRIKRGIFSFGVAKFLFSDLVHKKDFSQVLD